MKTTPPKWLTISFLTLSLIGLLSSAYLTADYYTIGGLKFPVLSISEEVTTSKFATILGIPTAMWGVFYFLIILMIILLYQDTKNKTILSFLMPIFTIGLVVSGWLLFAQIVIIKTICLHCLIPSAIAVILFILGIILQKNKTQEEG